MSETALCDPEDDGLAFLFADIDEIFAAGNAPVQEEVSSEASTTTEQENQ